MSNTSMNLRMLKSVTTSTMDHFLRMPTLLNSHAILSTYSRNTFESLSTTSNSRIFNAGCRAFSEAMRCFLNENVSTVMPKKDMKFLSKHETAVHHNQSAW